MRLCRELQGCPEWRFSLEAISVVSQFGCCFIQFPSFSYLRIGAFDGFPKRHTRYPEDKVVFVELRRQILEVNTLCSNVKKIIEIPFPIMVGSYSCASRSDIRNLVKAFESRIKLIDYEVIRPQYDPLSFVKDHLKLGYAYGHVLDIEDYWARCHNEYQTRERYQSRLTVKEINLYNDIVDVSDLTDDGSFMRPSTYDQIKETPIVPMKRRGGLTT